jgi:hypothetical protein
MTGRLSSFRALFGADVLLPRIQPQYRDFRADRPDMQMRGSVRAIAYRAAHPSGIGCYETDWVIVPE